MARRAKALPVKALGPTNELRGMWFEVLVHGLRVHFGLAGDVSGNNHADRLCNVRRKAI